MEKFTVLFSNFSPFFMTADPPGSPQIFTQSPQRAFFGSFRRWNHQCCTVLSKHVNIRSQLEANDLPFLHMASGCWMTSARSQSVRETLIHLETIVLKRLRHKILISKPLSFICFQIWRNILAQVEDWMLNTRKRSITSSVCRAFVSGLFF